MRCQAWRLNKAGTSQREGRPPGGGNVLLWKNSRPKKKKWIVPRPTKSNWFKMVVPFNSPTRSTYYVKLGPLWASRYNIWKRGGGNKVGVAHEVSRNTRITFCIHQQTKRDLKGRRFAMSASTREGEKVITWPWPLGKKRKKTLWFVRFPK